MRLLKCPKCNKYTLNSFCKTCNLKTTGVRPAKFSPQDSYGKYRRMMKKEAGKLN